MKSYPSIPRIKTQPGEYYVFDKLDGSNIRAEWTRKNSFFKFGSRNRLLDETDPILGESKELIISGWEKSLSDIFAKERYERVVCFFEFWGPQSRFGQHSKEPHKCNLFDVDIYKHGMLPPNKFVKMFGHLDIAGFLYQGIIDEKLVSDVKNSILSGITFEGVVCKSSVQRKRFSDPIMFKIKTDMWIERLKEYCAGDDKLYHKLF